MADSFYRWKIPSKPGTREQELDGLYAVRTFSIDKPEDFDKFSGGESLQDYLIRAATAAEYCLEKSGYKPSAHRYYYTDGTAALVGLNTHILHKKVLARISVFSQIGNELAMTGQSPEYLADSLLKYCWRAFGFIHENNYREALEPCMRVVDGFHRLAFTQFERGVIESRSQGRGRSNGGKNRSEQYPDYVEIQEWINKKSTENPSYAYGKLCQLAEKHFSAKFMRCQDWKTIRKNTTNPNK